jgi:hypothetical protein
MQLSCVVPLALLGTDGPMPGQMDSLLGRGIGHVAGIGLLGHKLPDEIARSVNAIQRYLVTETRLKIPAIFHNEALNGVVAPDFTAFPTPIGLAATWDPDAVEEIKHFLGYAQTEAGQRATAEGVPVDGYFHWSAQDNLEWMDGFGNRCGLVYVDFDTLERNPKLRAGWFREAARQNAVV